MTPLTLIEARAAAVSLLDAVVTEGAPVGSEVSQPTLNRVGDEWFAEVRVRLALGEVRRDA